MVIVLGLSSKKVCASAWKDTKVHRAKKDNALQSLKVNPALVMVNVMTESVSVIRVLMARLARCSYVLMDVVTTEYAIHPMV